MADLKKLYQEQGSDVLAVWVVGIKNSQLMQSNDYVSDASYVLSERPWYQLLLKMGGKEVLYVSTEGKNVEAGFNPKYFLDARPDRVPPFSLL